MSFTIVLVSRGPGCRRCRSRATSGHTTVVDERPEESIEAKYLSAWLPPLLRSEE